MRYAVEVWRYHKKSEYCVCKKKDVSRFISHTINDYDNGECAYHIYLIIFGIYKGISFRQKMKFLEKARQ